MYLIVDANVLLGAALGRSLALLSDIAAAGSVLLVPQPMMRETQIIAADKRRVPAADAYARLQLIETMVTALEPGHYEHGEARARERLTTEGQKDWPLLAASLALEAPIWSNDKHLWGTGVAVWRTQNIRYWTVGQTGVQWL
jgi:predicted nucleic acid-binding protein